MQLAELLWNGITDDIPSHVTVLDWVEKCGLSITKGCMKRKTAEEAYSIIFDNSITVCGQDLHLELKASSEHPGHSLKHADVSVLRMKAGKGWNTEMIKGQLEQTIKEEGRKPDYVVSDNGQIMCIASETLRERLFQGSRVRRLHRQEGLCQEVLAYGNGATDASKTEGVRTVHERVRYSTLGKGDT